MVLNLPPLNKTQEIAMTRSARVVLSWSRGVVDPVLRKAVDGMPEPLRHIAGYHFGWWDEDGRPTDADGGKAIRPALTLLAGRAVGGDPEITVPAAVAVELVHNFSLLHDDVMDGDLTRRHRRTAWSVFGRRNAILAGDAVLTLAFDVIAASGHPAVPAGLRMLSNTVLALLRGQHADLAFERRDDVNLAECQQMAESKTGALLGCSCALGGLFGGGSDEQVTQLRQFGERLGLAFQHFDDLLGIWGDPAATGKPVYSDLESRKKSLPVVAALTSSTVAGHELSELYRREAPLSTGELVHAAELVDLAGGRAWSQAQTEYLLTQALLHLRSVSPAEPAAAELAGLARLATRRDH
jgi:geranylgeranyl diphosphate synthase type I